MKSNHPFASHHADNQKFALEYLANTYEFRGSSKALRIDNRIYLNVAGRRRINPLSPSVPLSSSFELPGSQESALPSIDTVMRSRVSSRDFENRPMPLEALSKILWSSAGIRQSDPNGLTFRHYPSAGGLYPIQLFIGIQNVEGVEQGLYFYDPHSNCIQLINNKEAAGRCEKALLGGQPWVADASCFVLFVAETDKTLWKYGSRGLRYIHLDCGHLAQNISLMATACGMGSCGIGGFYEEEIHEDLATSPPDEVVIYAMALGVPKSDSKPDNTSSLERYA